MDESVSRRLTALNSHIGASRHAGDTSVEICNTSSRQSPQPDFNYGVHLPEKLSADGQWNVVRLVYNKWRAVWLASIQHGCHCKPGFNVRHHFGNPTYWLSSVLIHEQTCDRSSKSPAKLVATYQSPDSNVATLYDNVQTSISRHARVRYFYEPNLLGFVSMGLQLSVLAHNSVLSLYSRVIVDQVKFVLFWLQDPFLGTREQFADGHYGEYKWISYSEVTLNYTTVLPIQWMSYVCVCLLHYNFLTFCAVVFHWSANLFACLKSIQSNVLKHDPKAAEKVACYSS